MDIQTNRIGFNNLEYNLTASPLIPYIKLQGFASDGINWEDVEVATMEKGADGLAYINDKPVAYKGTFVLQPNSPSRSALDTLIDLVTVKFGKRIVDYTLVLTVSNYTTGIKTVYSGGTITTAPGGDNATTEGQQNKTYIFSFSDKTDLPL